MGTHVTPKTYPALAAAFRTIDDASDGAELPTGFAFYDVPDILLGCIGPGNAFLHDLLIADHEAFKRFCLASREQREEILGNQTMTVELRRKAQQAAKLLNTYFDGWEPDY